MSGASSEPRNVVEQAADAAISVVEAMLVEAGGTLDRLYVTFSASGLPDGELDAVTASAGLDADVDEAARELVAFLVTQAAQAGKALGVDIRVVPMRAPPGQG